MPMGTTNEPNKNDKMAPAPGTLVPPPGWAGTQNVDEPFLPEEFDRVLVMRCYPEAESTAELRETAYQHGREVLAMARESTRLMAELGGQPDPHDPTQQPPRPQPTPQPAPPPQPAQQPTPPQPGREARGQHQDDERERRQLEQAERDRRQHERDDKDDKGKK